MKTIWNIVSFLAVVHLLALATFAVWLWHSDRLDGARVQRVRELFSMTIPEAQVAAKRAQTQVKAELEERNEVALRADPPFSSAAAIEIGSQVTRHTEQEIRRLEDAKQRRLAQLAESQRLFEEQEAASKARVELWEKTAAAEVSRKTDEQFTKTVKLLESLPPKQAKQKIVELLSRGKTDQAVAYLNAMKPRVAAKVLGAFKTDAENKLATELLEQLTTFGLPADDLDDAGNADASPDTK